VIADAVADLIGNETRYRDMRKNARAYSLANSSWDKVGASIGDTIEPMISAVSAQ